MILVLFLTIEPVKELHALNLQAVNEFKNAVDTSSIQHTLHIPLLPRSQSDGWKCQPGATTKAYI